MPPGIGPATAVRRRIVKVSVTRPARQDPEGTGRSFVQTAVISAHKNPASSRAIAAATTLLVFLRAAR